MIERKKHILFWEITMNGKQSFRLSYAVLTLILTAVLISGLPNLVLGKTEITQDYHNELSGSGKTGIDVETINGEISISGYDGETVVIDAELSVTGKKKDVCEDLMSEIKIKIDESGKVISIEADTPKKIGKRGYNCSVSFTIKVPTRFSVATESVNGGLNLENIQGAVDAETVNGGVNLENVWGKMHLETVNGGIDLENIYADVEAETVNGAINAEFKDSAPENVSFEVVNGKIDTSFETTPNATIRAETVNGSLRVGGQKIKKTGLIGRSYRAEMGNGKGDYRFETVNGSIRIDVPDAD